METSEHFIQGVRVLEIIADGIVITGLQELLDIVSDYSVKRIIIRKENIDASFFDLSSGFAGEMLQKVSQYRIYLGILGDFETIENSGMQDFMWESNQGGQIVFKKTVKEVLRVFCRKE